jgi:zinc protease
MLNRQLPPPYKTIDRIVIQKVNSAQLDNGVDLFTLSAGSQEISRIELIFRAGMYHQPATLIASCTNTLLESGTRSFSADQISEGIDFYGSFLELQVEQDFASVTLYALNKYLEDSLKYIAEMVTVPTFPEEEFRIHVANKRQKHAINSQKVNVLAKRRFVELLFGEHHPYGVAVHDSDFDRVSVAELRAFFNQRYNFGNCTIIAAGNLPKDIRFTLNRYLGETPWGGKPLLKDVVTEPHQDRKSAHFVEREDAIQSAIRVGRLLFNKRHPDYFKFQVLNTILGGYFGSRLMANIREDKGYTYGIGSGLTNLVNAGYFSISTEVGTEVTGNTLEEIYREIGRLREDLVPVNELETVRNYMLGNFLRSVDGPFSLAEKFRSIWEYGLDYSFFDNYFAAVKSVRPDELRDLANRYLQREDLLECVSGKK